MPSLNKVMLIGNLTRDPELKYTTKGTAVTELSLAINRSYQVDEEKREEVTFVEVTFWGKGGEVIAQYLRKGAPLYVEGRLKLDTWDDKETGKKRSQLRVNGEEFQFLGGKEKGDRQESVPDNRQRQSPPQQVSTKTFHPGSYEDEPPF